MQQINRCGHQKEVSGGCGGFALNCQLEREAAKEIYTIKGMFIRQLPVSLKQLDAPCILYNLNGCCNSLKEFVFECISEKHTGNIFLSKRRV